jgi:hypothetical protein
LSLGGRFALVKLVLENILVYWLLLSRIPRLVLELIRRRIFRFLWSSHKEKERFHLVKWDRLARPKEFGEWGIKNIFHFGKSLATKSLWRALFTSSMWSEIIKAKYLKQRSVLNWIRDSKRVFKRISNVWSSLLHSFPIVNDWLIWKLGN